MTASARRPGSLRVASYNVHGWIGVDGRYDPERILRVVDEMQPDVLALQEVRAEPERAPLEALAVSLGAHVVRGVTLQLGGGTQGNALLSRLPVEDVARRDLSVPGREPRALIDARLATPVEPLRVVATHLGVAAVERRFPVERLVSHLGAPGPGVLVVLGDMNEWRRGVGALQPLQRLLGRTGGPRTFPARLPVFALDRIWVVPRERLRRLWVHRSPLAHRASDHLPVVAELALDGAGSA